MGSIRTDTGWIQAVLDEIHEDAWHSVRQEVSQIEVCGPHRRFVVTRMGSTGSTWLAKLLNSHADVLCTHEGVISKVYPRQNFDSSDIIGLVRCLAADLTHGAYLAQGDVGSVWTTHAVALRGKFITALLTRHPARILNTRLRVYPHDQSYTAIPSGTGTAIQRLWGIHLESLPPIDQIFLHDLLTFSSQVQLLKAVDLVIRIEDLQDTESCCEAVERLTGVPYEQNLVANAIRHRVNVRAPALPVPELIAGFSSSQREWYHTILRDTAPLFGYDLDDDRTFPLETVSAVTPGDCRQGIVAT